MNKRVFDVMWLLNETRLHFLKTERKGLQINNRSSIGVIFVACIYEVFGSVNESGGLISLVFLSQR